MRIEIPQLSLVALVGASASGKSTFAHRYFKPTEVLSSDFFRGMVCDDEADQSVTDSAFELLFKAAEIRLALGKLTVIDATNIQKNSRKSILELAKRQNVHSAAIVLDTSLKTLLERNAQRGENAVPEGVIRRHFEQLKGTVRSLKKEGFRYVFVVGEDDADYVEIVRTRLWNDRREEHGPFDIIGDVHGCFDELAELLIKLGYVESDAGFAHPEGRKAVFLGDLCDRGTQNLQVLKTVLAMVKSGNALAVPGNHDVKLVKYLFGKPVTIANGMENTVAEIDGESRETKYEIRDFLDGLISHFVLDEGRLVVSHAGIKQEYIGRASTTVRDFCIYGDVDGSRDEEGMPVRRDWAADYRGNAVIVYGHTPVGEVRNRNNTFCIDTGCVFGGSLTALRYPEMETVSVAAKAVYSEPARPFKDVANVDDIPAAEELLGKLRIETGLIPTITVQEQNTAAAFEAMSRFAADPRWLIYLPPTMSPSETSTEEDYLEYPTEAFAYYRKNGIKIVVCEKKHMGSRAVVVLCRNGETAKKRFSVDDGSRGIIYTRTGRRFFDNRDIERTILDRLDRVLEATNFWDDFSTDWVCLDTELMPWSEKAQGLIREQYAATGHAAVHGLNAVTKCLKKACDSGCSQQTEHSTDIGKLLDKFSHKADAAEGFVKAYGEYCWKVDSVDDIRIAPFHILACEGQIFTDKAHRWHMENIERYIAGIDDIFVKTPHIDVDTEDEGSISAGIDWWKNVTGNGGEGMVVKPEYYTAFNGKKLLQPAVKCRGREYLRIIYGAEYLDSENLSRLKHRSLKRKRDLALKEFALGVEALSRFVKKEPLYRVNQCTFGVLAMESEPTDPRL